MIYLTEIQNSNVRFQAMLKILYLLKISDKVVLIINVENQLKISNTAMRGIIC